MQLHFKRYHPDGSPTYFIEKIWSGFANEFISYKNLYLSIELFQDKFPYDYNWYPIFLESIPKIHTLREDKKDRWQPGKKIDFVQWLGRPRFSKVYKFTPVIPCVSTQQVEIKHNKGGFNIYVDGRILNPKELLQFANNDGFENLTIFKTWFKDDFKGKVIHWTNLKYFYYSS
jgi:hypothetical protein